jgi:hypothetical protein
MPRLSLYRPEKGNDFRFIDRVISEQFQVGGTDILVHKYLGPTDPLAGEASPAQPVNSNPIGELGIQDVLLMENRDRHYAPDVYVMRGIYQMQDLDFNLSQFGLFLNNDNIMIHFHLSGCVDNIGRKIMSGDVLELPHLKDEYALDSSLIALKRFYVVQDVTRPTNGFSQTWYPHLIRCKCAPLVDTQEFKEILDAEQTDTQGNPAGSLRDLMSTYKQSIEINQQIIAQAEADAPSHGFDTQALFVLPTNPDGTTAIQDVSDTTIDNTNWDNMDASVVLQTPDHNYFLHSQEDGVPPNGSPYGFGIEFPSNPVHGQFYLRTDYMPNRLFRFDGRNWLKFEDNVRMTLDQFGTQDVAAGTPNEGKQVRRNQIGSFINNVSTATINGAVVQERQSLSKALKPKADN